MKCDCGAEKHGWTHAGWCSTANSNFEVRSCEGFMGSCSNSGPGVKAESSRTMYHWDGTGENPNRDRFLCRECAKEHHEHWDEQWNSLYAGLYY